MGAADNGWIIDSELPRSGLVQYGLSSFTPVAELFVVYNHNVHSLLDRWQLESNQLLVKLQYAWRL